MSIMDNLELRLKDSWERIEEFTQRLQRHASLEESLDETGRGLVSASNKIGKLAESTESTLESFKKVQNSFQRVIEELRKSTGVLDAVTSVDEQLSAAHKDILALVSRVDSKTDTKLEKLALLVQEQARKQDEWLGIAKNQLAESIGQVDVEVKRLIPLMEEQARKQDEQLEGAKIQLAEFIGQVDIKAERLIPLMEKQARKQNMNLVLQVFIIVGIIAFFALTG